MCARCHRALRFLKAAAHRGSDGYARIMDTPAHAGMRDAAQKAEVADGSARPHAAKPAPHYPSADTQAEITRNLRDVRARIEVAAHRVGRESAGVRLLPVSKTRDETHIRFAVVAGCRWLGENKVQEAYRKWEAMQDLPDVAWSVIGHLQTNKAKYVARFAREFQALDSLRVAEVLDRRLQVEGRRLDVFVQVNTSGEASKYGVEPSQASAFVRRLPEYSNLRVRGLMTLAAFTTDAVRVRRCFTMLHDLRDQLRQDAPEGIGIEELSMGMSGDFEVAIQEGATVVRVGQAIFGPRALPDSYYWPAGEP